LLPDLPGNSEKGLANALSHGQGNKYGIYKKLERAGYTVEDDGDIIVGDGGSPSTPPILIGNNTRPEEHQIYYYHGDHLGSSNVLTDRFGRNYEHLEYFPYGETWVEESRNQTNLPYKFTGKELDPETGLYYFGARYYDPVVSIWVSVDPIFEKYLPLGHAAGGNKNIPGMGGVFNSRNLAFYTYAQMNPVNLIDPDGNFTLKAKVHRDGSLTYQLKFQGLPKKMQENMAKRGLKLIAKGAVGRVASLGTGIFKATMKGLEGDGVSYTKKGGLQSIKQWRNEPSTDSSFAESLGAEKVREYAEGNISKEDMLNVLEGFKADFSDEYSSMNYAEPNDILNMADENAQQSFSGKATTTMNEGSGDDESFGGKLWSDIGKTQRELNRMDEN
jgi:RHS repeat-associated protein